MKTVIDRKRISPTRKYPSNRKSRPFSREGTLVKACCGMTVSPKSHTLKAHARVQQLANDWICWLWGVLRLLSRAPRGI